MGGSVPKQPLAVASRGAKQPSMGDARPPDDAVKHVPISWGLKRVDLRGRWGWLLLEPEQVADLHRELAELEGATLHQLTTRRRVKDIPSDHMCTDAKARLGTLRLEERDTLWELRLDGKRRAWGLVEGSVFNLLWWDPDETACNPPPKGQRRR
jgi:hypothetical protein